MSIQIRLLGGFSAVVDGLNLPISGRSASVVAYLALAHRRSASRVVLAGDLWPEVDEARSLANLRAALWRMPGQMRAVIQSAGARRLRLREGVWVDIDLLNGLDPPHPSVDEIEGQLLPGWFDDWVVLERERVELRRVTVLERIASSHLQAGSFVDAIDVALSGIASNPYRESLHRIVIEAHAAEGNITEAIAHYRRLDEVLESEIGAQPSRTTQELVDRLVEHDRACVSNASPSVTMG